MAIFLGDGLCSPMVISDFGVISRDVVSSFYEKTPYGSDAGFQGRPLRGDLLLVVAGGSLSPSNSRLPTKKFTPRCAGPPPTVSSVFFGSSSHQSYMAHNVVGTRDTRELPPLFLSEQV